MSNISVNDTVIVDKQVERDYTVVEVKGDLALCRCFDTEEWFDTSRLIRIETPYVAIGASFKNEDLDVI
ncbi:hypothetical protein ACQKQC_17890 [Vibrio fortis]|uniref:hypothetical protein n=1 Tax=Vibrio fortis TaxID=212667 RepID=UPI00406949FE